MGDKDTPNSLNQLDIKSIVEILGFLGICFNVPNFYNSLAFTEKMYFLWGCTVIIFAIVITNLHNRIKTTETFCEKLDNDNIDKYDNKDKEVIISIFYEMLSIIINERTKKD